jgi:hypothetical protein
VTTQRHGVTRAQRHRVMPAQCHSVFLAVAVTMRDRDVNPLCQRFWCGIECGQPTAVLLGPRTRFGLARRARLRVV